MGRTNGILPYLSAPVSFKRLLGGCGRDVGASLEQSDGHRENRVGGERRSCGGLVRDRWRAEENVGLYREHHEAEQGCRCSAWYSGSEVQQHADEEEQRLEAKGQPRKIPESEADFGGIVIEREIRPMY